MVLVHVGALVAQPLVAESAQARGERGLRALGAALEGGEKTQRRMGQGRRGHRSLLATDITSVLAVKVRNCSPASNSW